MKLREKHKDELFSIAKRGLATAIAVLSFWGSTAPEILEEQNVFVFSRYAGAITTIVLIGCVRSSFCNLLTPGLSCRERKMGTILFWFCVSISFDLLWRLPYLALDGISKAPKTKDGMYWKIFWWSYSLNDPWYDSLNPLVTGLEIWRLLGNVTGGIGLYKYYVGDPQQKQKDYNECLLLFCVCGVLQCYNTSIYLFFSFYLGGSPSARRHILSQFVFWGLNCFWVLASATSSMFSYQLLLGK